MDVALRIPREWGACIVALCLAAPPSASGACRILKLAELQVSLIRNRPLIEGQINGHVVKILVDTGSTLSFVWEEQAKELGLRINAVPNASVFGADGEARFRATVIEEIRFGPFTDKNLQLAVVGSQQGRRHRNAALVLGEDFFSGNPSAAARELQARPTRLLERSLFIGRTEQRQS
jgi:gag-polyprotein putative aspartyl protease